MFRVDGKKTAQINALEKSNDSLIYVLKNTKRDTITDTAWYALYYPKPYPVIDTFWQKDTTTGDMYPVMTYSDSAEDSCIRSRYVIKVSGTLRELEIKNQLKCPKEVIVTTPCPPTPIVNEIREYGMMFTGWTKPPYLTGGIYYIGKKRLGVNIQAGYDFYGGGLLIKF